MKITLYQIDAFTADVFSGNPAGVCPLPAGWLDERVMQNISRENNLAETAFYTRVGDEYHIRWFTPLIEVDLCGHATLAAAFVLFNREGYTQNEIVFSSRSGLLKVRKDADYLTLDFPTDVIQKADLTAELKSCFDTVPIELYKGKTDYLFVFESEDQVRNVRFNLDRIRNVKARGVIITARGRQSDFVSRFFAPQSGIDEDPVTGSAHTTLTPYWSGVLGKRELTAIQLSKRQGYLKCKNMNERTEISGKAVQYLKGEITI